MALREIRSPLKGQSYVLEQLMLFSLGIAIFMVFFSAFTVYRDYFQSTTNADQIDQVKDYLTAYVLKAAQNERNVTSSFTVNIPKTLSGEPYKIEVTGSDLVITGIGSKIVRKSNLYNLTSSYDISGQTTSMSGRITIKRTGDKINII